MMTIITELPAADMADLFGVNITTRTGTMIVRKANAPTTTLGQFLTNSWQMAAGHPVRSER